jgi:hypothetical protein
MRLAAEYLNCSVLDLADADPEWRRMALAILRARKSAEDQRQGENKRDSML